MTTHSLDHWPFSSRPSYHSRALHSIYQPKAQNTMQAHRGLAAKRAGARVSQPGVFAPCRMAQQRAPLLSRSVTEQVASDLGESSDATSLLLRESASFSSMSSMDLYSPTPTCSLGGGGASQNKMSMPVDSSSPPCTQCLQHFSSALYAQDEAAGCGCSD